MLQSEKSSRTHRQLLSAAKKLFLQRGFNHTGIADIVAEAGYSTGVFYRHFKTKPDILLELWSEFLESFITESIRGAMEAPGLDQAIDYLMLRSGEYFSHPMVRCYYEAGIVKGETGGREFIPAGAKDFTNMLYSLLKKEYPTAGERCLRTYASAMHAVINAYSASEELGQDYFFDEQITRRLLLTMAREAGYGNT